MSERKKKALSLKDKLQLIADSKLKTKPALSKKFGCSISTVNRILRCEKEILGMATKINLESKRNRSGAHKKMEEALKLWFDQMRSTGANMTSSAILEKAQQLADRLNENFTPTPGWLWRWQRREGVKFRRSNGNCKSEDTQAKSCFQQLPSAYQARDIFSAGETALFYNAIPSSSLPQPNSEATGGSNFSKERVTVLLVCNSTGDYKKVYVIGKRRNAKCLKHKILPVIYYFNEKAWMTHEIWSDILRKINEEMEKLNRKIVMYVDDAAEHINVSGLSNVKLQFFLSESPAIIRPLNLGIIQSFKTYYRRNIVRRQLAATKSGKTVQDFVNSLDLFQAMHIINHSWSLVQPSCIKSCFQKAGLYPNNIKENQKSNTDLIEDVFRVDETFKQIFKIYINCDNNTPCYDDLSNKALAMNGALDNGSNESDTDEEIVPHKPIPTKELLSAIELLQRYFLIQNKFSKELEHMWTDIVYEKLEKKQ